MHLSLVVTIPSFTGDPSDLRFLIIDNEREFPVNSTLVGDGQYRLEFNVTNFTDRRQIPNGTWRIVPRPQWGGKAAGRDVRPQGDGAARRLLAGLSLRPQPFRLRDRVRAVGR
ncbi:hypothetical protein GTV15_02335 [Streptomyces sp. SID7803]|nr:hypothetical protein [Streptomyces sp. SID7803]